MTEYGAIHVTDQHPVVERADQVILCSLSVFQDAQPWFLRGPDMFHPGNDNTGEPVYYRVVGWDAKQRALIAHRCDGRGQLIGPPLTGQQGGSNG